MKAVLGGVRCELDLDRMVGEGGEAVVVEHPRRPGLVVKVYRDASTASRGKLEALMALAPELPSVALPVELAEDARGGLIGFAMRRIPASAEPVAVLATLAGRRALGWSLADVCVLFASVAEDLGRMHRAGVIVGDLNDHNELVEPSSRRATWIDADSFQVEGFPCLVSTPLTLDPLLYGPSEDAPWLTADGAPRWFSRASDAYAFAVILFRALVGVHPFGGVGTHGGSVVARARARETVFDAGVVLPTKVRRRIDALDRDLARRFEAFFGGSARLPFEREDLLRIGRAVSRCACGEERFADAPCVGCGTGAVVSSADAAPMLDVREISFDGVVAHAFADERGVVLGVRRTSGHVDVLELSHELAVRRERRLPGGASHVVALSSREALFVAGDARAPGEVALLDLASGAVDRTAAELAFGAPACALGPRGLVRIVRGSVLSRGPSGEAVITTVVREQTSVVGGPGGVALRTLALGGITYQWLGGGRTEVVLVGLLDPSERALEERVFCEASQPTIVRRVVSGVTERLVVAREGRVTRHDLVGAPPFTLAGAVLRDATLLVPTDAGVLRVHTGSGLTALIAETEPHVSAADALVAAGPHLFIVSRHSVRRITRRAA